MKNDIYIDYSFVKQYAIEFLIEYKIIPLYETEIYIVLASFENTYLNRFNLEKYFEKPIKIEIYNQEMIENKLKFLDSNIKLAHFAHQSLLHQNNKSKNTYIENFLYSLFHFCIEKNVSDIHVELIEKYIFFRVRIDGELLEIFRYEKEFYDIFTAIIKLKSNLDLAKKQTFQDGRFYYDIEDKRYNFRISILPTIEKESIVIRVLNQEKNLFQLYQLGLNTNEQNILLTQLQKTQGMVLITGATGSGKTTTMYSILNILDKQKKKIISLEDPVEYNISGITQVSINEKIGLSYPKLLKRVLRQDPDVILIGEIRDKESLKIAVQAALTGHLVIATLHTNSALKTLERLIDFEMEPYLIASVLKLIVSQKLIRILCEKCKEEHISDKQLFFEPKGCAECDNSGFKNRKLVAEFLQIDYITATKIRENNFDEIIFDSKEQIEYKIKDLVYSGKTPLSEYYFHVI